MPPLLSVAGALGCGGGAGAGCNGAAPGAGCSGAGCRPGCGVTTAPELGPVGWMEGSSAPGSTVTAPSGEVVVPGSAAPWSGCAGCVGAPDTTPPWSVP